MIQYSERKRKANPIEISSFLEKSVRNFFCESDVYLEQLKNNWEKIVGSANAKNTHPSAIKRGVLSISVSSPVWLTQARFYKISFLKKVNGFKVLNSTPVSDIDFFLDLSK